MGKKDRILTAIAILDVVIVFLFGYNLYKTYGDQPSIAAERWASEVTNAYLTQNEKVVLEKDVPVEREKELRELADEIANTMEYGRAEIKVFAKEENRDYSRVTLGFNHVVNPDPYCDILKKAYAEMVCYDLLQTATYRSDLQSYFVPTRVVLKNAGKEYEFNVSETGGITKEIISRRWL